MDETDPPRLGMRGNLRVLMMDRDADESAARMRDRLAGQGPRRWRDRGRPALPPEGEGGKLRGSGAAPTGFADPEADRCGEGMARAYRRRPRA